MQVIYHFKIVSNSFGYKKKLCVTYKIILLCLTDLLESLTDWVLEHSDVCRPQDISSLFLTLATLNYPTTKAGEIKSKLSAGLVEKDFAKAVEWLNNVWALSLLNFADTEQIESVLK